jgi:type I restriction enzyme S subunit
VLFSSRAPIGYVAIAANPISTNQGFKSFVLEQGLVPDFVYYYLLSAKPIAIGLASGTTFLEISAKKAALIPIPVPPTAEQVRIADALDELFSDLDAAMAALERVRDKLSLYRVSVLKAAVEGTLTAEWRAEHPDVEPASELLERILSARRRRWEENQLARFRAKGQTPPKNWKAKYVEPAAPDTRNLPALPDGWCWVSMDQLAWSAGYGTSEKCREINTGLPVVRIPNVIAGALDLTDLKFATSEYPESIEDLLDVGDLLVVRTNGSRSLIGRGALIGEKPERPLAFASYLIRLRLIPVASVLDWVSLAWQTSLVRQWIEQRAATSAGQFNISLGTLRPLLIPLPPAAEQEEAVDAADDQLSVIDHLEADLQAKLESAQALRQAILRHAFAGRLVPQDPSDEPASELLKRIAAEREERAQAKAGPKQQAKRAKRSRRIPKIA